MWIKTQQGELLNLDRLRTICLATRQSHNRQTSNLVMGDLDFDRSVTLGEFDTSDEADAYFDQLEKLLTKESDHD